ncbi:MAG: exo-alpha-sialidase [Bryobacteraceae bacterium]
MTRRDFIPGIAAAAVGRAASKAPGYRIELNMARKGYDGKTCWVHPRAGVIPGRNPAVVLTMQQLLVTGSDVFYALNEMRTDDMGRAWTGPKEHSGTLGRRNEAGGIVVAASDFWPKWHSRSRKLLCIGHTVRYRNNKVAGDLPRQTSYSVYDPTAKTWTPWNTLPMPPGPKFENAGAGSVQRYDLPNGDILLPVYFNQQKENAKLSSVTVLRCRFDGRALRYVEQGNDLSVNTVRGVGEPSLARFNGRYYLTLRHDLAGYVSSSTDGLHFDEPRTWRFDDGNDLGNYNTQQHWVTHSSGLFLVYTRRGAGNDHVFRHRAPLFMAQVDPEKLVVIRATEKILVPERGARLGNFGVVAVNERETWVTVAEWMQTWGPNYIMPVDNPRGSDNSVYAARILWDQPNRDWDKG